MNRRLAVFVSVEEAAALLNEQLANLAVFLVGAFRVGEVFDKVVQGRGSVS